MTPHSLRPSTKRKANASPQQGAGRRRPSSSKRWHGAHVPAGRKRARKETTCRHEDGREAIAQHCYDGIARGGKRTAKTSRASQPHRKLHSKALGIGPRAEGSRAEQASGSFFSTAPQGLKCRPDKLTEKRAERPKNTPVPCEAKHSRKPSTTHCGGRQQLTGTSRARLQKQEFEKAAARERSSLPKTLTHQPT